MAGNSHRYKCISWSGAIMLELSQRNAPWEIIKSFGISEFDNTKAVAGNSGMAEQAYIKEIKILPIKMGTVYEKY
jgi:hypothetical protein